MSGVPERFDALRVHRSDAGDVEARLEQVGLDDLAPGEVVIAAQFSDINYKDALAVTGAGRIMRRFPLVGGIDVAGEVVSSDDHRYRTGEAVLVTGCGLGEDRDGGYSEYVRVPGDAVVPLPPGLDAWHAMCLGTAGFTAALAIHRMEHNGQRPDGGPVAVTGATGGVGSIAVDMLAGRGYEVVAVTGKDSADEYLRELGAARVLRRDEIDLGQRPLEKAQWAGAIDNVGGELLTWLTRTTNWWGNIASIGLAASPEVHTTVMPFILRGINLLGINSVATPRELRLAVWQRIATDLAPRHLERIGTRTIALHELATAFEPLLRGEVTGRTVVRLRD